MAILTVGKGMEFSTIDAAITASHDGDVIQVNAGAYTNEFATIGDSITLEAVGSRLSGLEPRVVRVLQNRHRIKTLLTIGLTHAGVVSYQHSRTYRP